MRRQAACIRTMVAIGSIRNSVLFSVAMCCYMYEAVFNVSKRATGGVLAEFCNT